MRFARRIGLTLSLVALLTSTILIIGGCAHAKHIAVVADQSLSQALFAMQDAEIASHDAHVINDADHAKHKAQIRKLLVAGDDLTVALQHWQSDQPVPASISTALADVRHLLADAKLLPPAAADYLVKIQAVLDALQKFGVIPSEVAHA